MALSLTRRRSVYRYVGGCKAGERRHTGASNSALGASGDIDAGTIVLLPRAANPSLGKIVIRIEPHLIKTHQRSRKTEAHSLRLSEPAFLGDEHFASFSLLRSRPIRTKQSTVRNRTLLLFERAAPSCFSTLSAGG
jgi:hypothetical protein